MLELRLAQATLLKNALEALNDLFSEANFDFSDKGLELQALDTRGVALVALLLRPEAFSKYCCDRDLSMGLNLADMAKVFRCINNDDIITITAEDAIDWCDTVTFTFESTEVGAISSFEFDFVGVNDVPFEITEYPESDYKAIVCMPSAKFMSICKLLSSIGDGGDAVVVISVYEEQVDFITWGKPGSSRIVCRQTQTGKPKECTLIEMKENVSLTFDLRYMNSFSKVSTLSDQVTIRLSSKLPAMFEYKIAEGYIRYYMSPRNAKEDEMQNEGDEMQRIAKEDKMQNEGDEMQN